MGSKNLMLAAAIYAAATNALAGPFGLNPGDSLETLSRLGKLKPTSNVGVYSTTTLPQGHPDLDDYRLVISPTTGLCKVSAWTPAKSTSVYGDQIRTEFEKWQAALASKYGAPKKYDFLRQGSIWRDDKDYTMALSRKERTLAAFWTREGANDGVETISLTAVAGNSTTYMINVAYDFNNIDECMKSLNSKKNANL